MLDVSIIIVSYNTRSITLECLEAIRAETGTLSAEVIVVDNGSSDGSVEAIRERFPEVLVLAEQMNLGFAAANNVGIRLSQGRYVCLANSDTVVRHDCIRELVRFLNDNPDVGIVGPRLLWPDLSLQLSCREFPTLWNNLCPSLGLTRLFPHTRRLNGEHMTYFRHDTLCDVDAIVGAFLIARRTAIEAVGIMDERFFFYCEEIDWCKRFREGGWRVVFYPYAEVIHLGRGSSSSYPTRFAREFVISSVRYWIKHHGLLKAKTFLGITLLRHILRIPAACCHIPIRQKTSLVRTLQARIAVLWTCIRLLLDCSGLNNYSGGHRLPST